MSHFTGLVILTPEYDKDLEESLDQYYEGREVEPYKVEDVSDAEKVNFLSFYKKKENGGYDTVSEAAEAMGHIEERIYHPIPENVLIYDKLFAEFKRLHDYFGTGINDVMKRLKKIREEAEG